MIAQYSTWDTEENKTYGYTYDIKGTTEQEEFAKWLWSITKDLSDAVFHGGNIEENLAKEGYDDNEIKKILAIYPNFVSEDPFSAYDQCIAKLKAIGMEITELENSDNPAIWTSHGIY